MTQVLHGAWVPAQGSHPERLAIWSEDSAAGSRRGRKPAASGRAGLHPFAGRGDDIRAALAAGGGATDAALEPARLWARLPSRDGAPLASPDAGGPVPAADGAGVTLQAWRVEALTCDAAQVPGVLLALTPEELPPDLVLAEDFRFCAAAARFALDLLIRGRVFPALEAEKPGYGTRWRPLLAEAPEAGIFEALAAGMPAACRAFAWDADAPAPGPRRLLTGYLGAVSDAVARAAVHDLTALGAARRGRKPAIPETAAAWWATLGGDPQLGASRAEAAAFAKQYRAWTETGAAGTADTFRLCFRLAPPAPADTDTAVVAPAANARDWNLEYLLQATDEPSLHVPVGEVWRQRGATARLLNRKLDNPQERVLAGLGRASRLFPPIESSLHTATPEGSALTVGEAYDLVREKALVLQAGGFGVLVPGLETRVGVRVRLGTKRPRQKGPAGPGVLTWGTLVGYDWQVALGDVTLSRQEFEALARLKEPLVQVRGQWIELRPELVAQALALFGRAKDGALALPEAIRLALAPESLGNVPVVAVDAEGEFATLLQGLRNGGRRETIDRPPGFHGDLRPYQKLGVSWLDALARYGLGACLADDMGLGKTVQLIALLLHRRAAAGPAGPALLICPTSVVGNWRRELARFAPELRVLVHHGPERRKETFGVDAAAHDVVISTYALLYRDEAELAGVEWDALVLDEAQNIKNPGTRYAQTARKLPARWRAALTGTPVENRLSELWSIFQFLNPGYLGAADDFQARFARPIERAHDAAASTRLKALVAPFILRRVKTDRSIIADLPEKNEMKLFCTLTREQATLYEAVLKESLRKIEEASGIERRGEILGTLTRLKQVCDHPALFLHDGSPLPGRSGKLARLGEMLDEARAIGDRALVFTQYAEMGKLLKAHLESVLSQEVLFLYGGTPAPERDRMVERFQAGEHGPGVFILSLKAGGTGLNLTRANHVFHFDRWWNPAVENQATDRAFRIGQRRDVQVHKFITAGTFEEALDDIIERKRALAESIVGTSEAWITELSTAELRDLFALRQDAVAEE